MGAYAVFFLREGKSTIEKKTMKPVPERETRKPSKEGMTWQ
jgi:hypothetical protein